MPLRQQPNAETALRNARLDLREARDLLSHVMRKPVSYLLAHPDTKLTAKQHTTFKKLIAQRKRGVPFAYLTGTKGFYGLDFAVTKDVLIPRPETEQLVDWAIQHYRGKPCTIADIGTGSGCIAIALARFLPDARIIATDVSVKALVVAKQNARHHGIAKRVTFRKGSLLSPIKPSEHVDLVVANLPYLTKDQLRNVPHEPTLALHGGKRGLELIAKLLQQIADRQIPAAILEIDPQQERWLTGISDHLQGFHSEFLSDLAGRVRFLTITTT